MLEMVVYAEQVPKVSKGNMWKDNEVLRFVLLFLCSQVLKTTQWGNTTQWLSQVLKWTFWAGFSARFC